MELIRIIVETAGAWARDVFVNLSGRIAEEFVGRRIQARRKRRRRKIRSRIALRCPQCVPRLFTRFAHEKYLTPENLWASNARS